MAEQSRLIQRLKPIWQDGEISIFQQFKPHYTLLFNSRWTVLFLLIIGILRAGLFLFSYAPADGADAGDYYAYSAYIAGFNLPDRAANVSPMYPLLLYVSKYILGSINWVIVFQQLMSIVMGILMYWGLRRYHAFFAFVVALVVLGDAQIGVLFNFTSTEPLYIFLLIASFALAMSSAHQSDVPLWQPLLLGISLFFLSETRTVGIYLMPPVLLLYAIATRHLTRIGLALGAYIVTALVFSTLMNTFNIAQTSTTNMVMYSHPLIEVNLHQPDAGPASAQLESFFIQCDLPRGDQRFSACVEADLGTEQAVGALYRDAYLEVWRADPWSMVQAVRRVLYQYLRVSGLQYQGTPTPATVQCADVEQRAENNATYILTVEWSSVSMTAEQEATYRQVMRDFTEHFCPPWIENDQARAITDYLGKAYSVLSPQQPYLIQAVLLVSMLLLPWVRRFWYPYLMSVGIWLYHILISTLVLSVQPRYVVVTNPMRTVFLVLLLYIIGAFIVRAFDLLRSRTR